MSELACVAALLPLAACMAERLEKQDGKKATRVRSPCQARVSLAQAWTARWPRKRPCQALKGRAFVCLRGSGGGATLAVAVKQKTFFRNPLPTTF